MTVPFEFLHHDDVIIMETNGVSNSLAALLVGNMF